MKDLSLHSILKKHVVNTDLTIWHGFFDESSTLLKGVIQ